MSLLLHPKIPARLHAQALELGAPDTGFYVLSDSAGERKRRRHAGSGSGSFIDALLSVGLEAIRIAVSMVPVAGLRASRQQGEREGGCRRFHGHSLFPFFERARLSAVNESYHQKS